MEGSSLQGLSNSEISFVRPRRGGPQKDGMIIEVGLALVLWNQDLSSEREQLARQKIKYMRGEKEFRGSRKGEGYE